MIADTRPAVTAPFYRDNTTEGTRSTPTQTVSLDLSRSGVLSQRVHLGCGDKNGTVLKAIITDGGDPFDCDGLTPYLVVPMDGSTVRWEGTASGNVATIPIDESDLGDFSGKVGDAYVSLESDDMATSTQRLIVVVLPGATEESTDESTEDTTDESAGDTTEDTTDDSSEGSNEGS